MRWTVTSTESLRFDELPDAGEVVIVVFGDEEQVVGEAHGRFQTRMRDRGGESVGAEAGGMVEKSLSFLAQSREDFLQWAFVVASFVRFAIAEIGRSQFVFAGDEIVDAGEPERLKVEQMSGFFLSGPFPVGLGGENCRVAICKKIL
jgi:hypothetical protein